MYLPTRSASFFVLALTLLWTEESVVEELVREENERLEPHEIGYILGSGIVINLFRKNHSLELQLRKGMTPVFSIGDNKYFFTTLAILYGLYF